MTESKTLDLPWPWIGGQGTGQEPMTQSQFDWLKERNMSREDYMAKISERQAKRS